MPELLEKYDDEHLVNLYAVGVLDGDGEDDRRAARIACQANVSVMNAVRLSGREVDGSLYRSEDDFMPQRLKSGHKQQQPQTWDEQRGLLGF